MSRRADDERAVDLDITDAGTDPGADEELPEPSGARALRGRRSQVVVGVGVAVALLALVLARVLSTGGDTPAAAPSGVGSATVAPTSARPAGPVEHGGQQVEQCLDLKCGQDVMARLRTRTPADVRAALQRRFPGARIVSATNIVDPTGSTLLFRRVVARFGDRTVELIIAPYRTGDSDRSGYVADGAGSRVYFEHRRRLLQITVRVIAPVGTHLTLDPVLDLGVDDRILAI